MGDESRRSHELRRRSHQNLSSVADTDLEKRPTTTLRSTSPFLGYSITLLGLVLITFFLIYFRRYVTGNEQSALIADVEKEHSRGDLDIVLHPQDHVYRQPASFHHDWVVKSSELRPDGVLKPIYTINDLFPGPVIEARPGDKLIINVHNGLPSDHDGISIHWHGLYMRGQNKFDGAVGLTQNPISPGGNFTYEITIADDQWGTYWYHAHDQVQRADGLFGAFVIHRPAKGVSFFSSARTDLARHGYDEERLLMIGDWYHRSADEVLAWYMRSGSFGNEPVPDSLIINGRGSYNCSMAVPARPLDCAEKASPKLSLDPTKKYRFRIISHGSLAGFSLSLDGAGAHVIEVDGGNEVKANSSAHSIGVVYPGQRIDLIVKPVDLTRSSTMTVLLDRENFKYPNPALSDIQTFPIIPHSSAPTKPSTGDSSTTDVAKTSIDLESSLSAEPVKMPQTAELTLVLYTTTQKLSQLHNVPHGFMNQTTWRPQSDPALPLIDLPRSSWDKHQFVPQIPFPPSLSRTSRTNVGFNGRGKAAEPLWLDLIVNNLDDGSHPFHLHGYSVYVLSSYTASRGWGSYNPFDTSVSAPGGDYNTLNPPRRDTFWVPRRGYTVVRFQADNPGIWMFHCHLLWHQASGMAMGIEVGGKGM